MRRGPLPDPVAEFEALRPLAQRLRQLQGDCRPFGRDYLALAIAMAALEETAEHFTGRRHFYGAHQDTVGPIRS